MFQEQLLRYKNIKLYLARFTARVEGIKSFYKIGVTSKYDAAERFLDEEYNLWDIKIMTTAYGPTREVLEAEDELKLKYKKNLWLDQKIKGVTEIFVPRDKQDIQDIIEYIKNKRITWYDRRANEASEIEKLKKENEELKKQLAHLER